MNVPVDITELSKKVLSNYAAKAVDDHGTMSKQSMVADPENADRLTRKSYQRYKGIRRALGRLAKESRDEYGQDRDDTWRHDDSRKKKYDASLAKASKGKSVGMKEDSEEGRIDELSQALVKRYVRKSSRDSNLRLLRSLGRDPKIEKRRHGYTSAMQRVSKGTAGVDRHDRTVSGKLPRNESNLDELSQSLLGRYRSAAEKDRAARGSKLRHKPESDPIVRHVVKNPGSSRADVYRSVLKKDLPKERYRKDQIQPFYSKIKTREKSGHFHDRSTDKNVYGDSKKSELHPSTDLRKYHRRGEGIKKAAARTGG